MAARLDLVDHVAVGPHRQALEAERRPETVAQQPLTRLGVTFRDHIPGVQTVAFAFAYSMAACPVLELVRSGIVLYLSVAVADGDEPAESERALRHEGHFGDTRATLATRGPFCRYVGTSRSSQILPPSKPPTRRDPPQHAASAAPAASTVQSISASLCAAESMQALFPRPMVAEPADQRARLGGAGPARAHPLRFFFTPNPLSNNRTLRTSKSSRNTPTAAATNRSHNR